MTGSEALPMWDLDPVFPGFDSEKYLVAKKRAEILAAEAQSFFETTMNPNPGESVKQWLLKALALNNELGEVFETLSSYAYARYSTATRDQKALAEINAIDELSLPAKRAEILYRNALANRAGGLMKMVSDDQELKPYAYHIEESLMLQEKQMAPDLEDLAEDLGRSGTEAWSRLQEAVSSNSSTLWDALSGTRKTVVELRNLAFDPDRNIREKAYDLELNVWKQVEIPLAAALNGVKGTTNSLAKRRGWHSALHTSMSKARISEAALNALISAMESSLPMWRRYLKTKAKALKLGSLAFFDLFAPVEKKETPLKTFSWSESRDFIREKFSSFDPDMGNFAQKAFALRWIDALPREGKVGGAYCTDFPMAKTARVLCNFDGSFSSVTTVAHELGHAWHHECILGKPHLLTQYPMTLAETASIFAETIVSESALAAASPAERLSLVEMHLQDGCQVIVDILSRFYFEKKVFDARKDSELSPEQLCSMMLEAQTATYGEGLDQAKRHPYMWAVKGHYYIPSLSFYNFPYAFGQLFGLGLYERYRQEGSSFVPVYIKLLAETGMASAVDVAKQAGFDIEDPEFWISSLAVFERQTEEFESLVTELL